MDLELEQDQDLKTKLLSETAKTEWRELERFFARGVLFWVDGSLDLLHVAIAMAEDDSKKIQQFMELGQLAKVRDEQAKKWLESQPLFWTVAVAPFVLIQQVKT